MRKLLYLFLLAAVYACDSSDPVPVPPHPVEKTDSIKTEKPKVDPEAELKRWPSSMFTPAPDTLFAKGEGVVTAVGEVRNVRRSELEAFFRQSYWAKMSSRSFLEQGKLDPDTVSPWVGTVYNGFSMVKGKLKNFVSFDADACNQEQVVTYDERSNVLTIHQKQGETHLQIVYFSPYRLEAVYFKTENGRRQPLEWVRFAPSTLEEISKGVFFDEPCEDFIEEK